MATPYIGFDNAQLATQRPLRDGDEVWCPHCGGVHKVTEGTNAETGEPTDLLLFYQCSDTEYLAGVAGKSVMNTKPVMKGLL